LLINSLLSLGCLIALQLMCFSLCLTISSLRLLVLLLHDLILLLIRYLESVSLFYLISGKSSLHLFSVSVKLILHCILRLVVSYRLLLPS